MKKDMWKILLVIILIIPYLLLFSGIMEQKSLREEIRKLKEIDIKEQEAIKANKEELEKLRKLIKEKENND